MQTSTKKYYIKNRDKILQKKKEYRFKNKEQIKLKDKERYDKNRTKILEKKKIYFIKSKNKRAHYIKTRYHSNINYKLSMILRNRLRRGIKNNQKSGSAVKDLGCSIEKFKLWLEMHWQNGMSWDNYGRGGWVIDHIVPLAKFDLSDKNQLLKAVNFSNLQPLWETDNLSKGDKLEWTKD